MTKKSIAVRTRELLLDEARRLFAEKGVDNTTMLDIAQASKKGRRTLYTYFKSKDELYHAVISTELEYLCTELDKVVTSEMSPDEKLISFIYTRLGVIKQVVDRNGSLRANFFRDIWRVQKVRRSFDYYEITMIEKILQEGINSGTFQMPNAKVTATILHHAFKGLEVPYIRDILGTNIETRRENIINLLFSGLIVRPENKTE